MYMLFFFLVLSVFAMLQAYSASFLRKYSWLDWFYLSKLIWHTIYVTMIYIYIYNDFVARSMYLGQG